MARQKNNASAPLLGNRERKNKQQQQQQEHQQSHQQQHQEAVRHYSMTRARVGAILVPVFYFAGIIPTDTLLPQYVVHKLTLDAGHSSDNVSLAHHNPCHREKNQTSASDALQSQASDLVLYYKYAYCGPALLACLFLGGFGDVFGRKPLLLFAVATGLLRSLGISLCIRLNLSLWTMYIPHAVDGISGSWYIIFCMLCSTISDMNEQRKDRVVWIAVLGCCVSLVSAIFIILNGLIIDSLGYFTASMFSVGATACSFLTAVFIFPDTLPPPETKTWSILSNVKRIMGYFVLEGSIRERMVFWIGTIIFMFCVMNVTSIGTIDSLYQIHRPFCWSPFYIGLYNGLRMAGQLVVSTVILKLAQRCFRDAHIAMVGLLFQAASFFMEAFITKSWQFSVVPVVGALGAVSPPVIRALMSSLASPANQGVVYSSLAVMEVACNIVCMTGVLRVYSATVSTLPGAAYILMASFSLSGFLLFFVLLKLHHKDKRDYNYEEIVQPINHSAQDS